MCTKLWYIKFKYFPYCKFFNFNSWKWLSYNLFLQYPYIIQWIGNENIETYQVEVVILIKHQILIKINKEICSN